MRFTYLAAAAACFLATTAEAHISISSGPAFATKTVKISFSVGHGCESGANHYDTYKVRIDLPAGVSSVRPMASDFGKALPIKAGLDTIAYEWEKPTYEAEDFMFYEIVLRAKIDAAPFTTLNWKITQWCKDGQGNEILPPTVWDGPDAAKLIVMPARIPGWNKYTLAAPIPMASLPTYFVDAQIVWRNTAAYSANANIMAQIAMTNGVTAIAGDLAAGDEIWVKY